MSPIYSWIRVRGRGHVDRALRAQLGLPLGLADPNVHVLDPCTGTGSYLTAVLDRIVTTLKAQGGDGLVAAEAKQAALSRIHGFELLPAPFVIAHLRIGIALQRLGVPLNAKTGERASVYLTNALTGWVEGSKHPTLPFPEFADERDAADAVKQDQPILVVLGNPPYNGFAGVSGREEGGLAEPYKAGLTENWDITKNKLDDLYIRFFRIAELPNPRLTRLRLSTAVKMILAGLAVVRGHADGPVSRRVRDVQVFLWGRSPGP